VLQEKEAHLEKEFQDQVERLLNRQRDLLRRVRERLKAIDDEERQREILEELRRDLEASRGTLEAARKSAPQPAPAFALGDEVESTRLGLRGDVVEVLPARGEVVVRSRGKRFQVSASELVSLPRGSASRSAGGEQPGGGTVTYAEGGEAPDEIDLRGLTAEGIDLPLSRGIDRAVAANLGRLRIIHGKGGGVLREQVRARLSADPRVRSFRLGQWHEGGSGVTVAELA